MSKWISVKNELPENGRFVLVFLRNMDYVPYKVCLHLGENEWSTHSGNITHWQPLPEPPAGDE